MPQTYAQIKEKKRARDLALKRLLECRNPEQQIFPQLGEIVESLLKKLSVDELTTMIADEMRNGSPKFRTMWVKAVVDMIRLFHDQIGDIGGEEVAELSDDVLAGMLGREFAFVPDKRGKQRKKPIEPIVDGKSGTENPEQPAGGDAAGQPL